MNTKPIISTATFFTILIATQASFVSADQTGGASCRQQSHGERHMKHIGDKLDVDKDGSITQAEIDSLNEQRLNEFDKDQSASLNVEEYEKLWLAKMRHRMVDQFQHLDEDGDGQVSPAEFSAPSQMMMSHHDDNNDGVITMNELKNREHKRQHGGHDRKYKHDADQPEG